LGRGERATVRPSQATTILPQDKTAGTAVVRRKKRGKSNQIGPLPSKPVWREERNLKKGGKTAKKNNDRR